ncbi:bifunctional acetate--CoA ligase family protein/GNAT family N-acetyltransferase [Spirulina major CS-329]|uniref:bifunctional acetate--CoA ligase family protein/GNAT family N-acetyltransferase n=1 Tax=Spirulina sp. TaxID=1157 RepID=UPI003F6F6188|nr:bifunctional acetate--CoA ligase family protein/GNAT family N-acetyltransferase [Spirulina subsalsa CS-330]MDB9501791.1 bifunctional acetate--CoA ligase family protein/GNAT family N-acetyltransferase [Spirulina major CS-329]
MMSFSMQTADPAQNVLHYDQQPLKAFFQPQSVAIIGASEKPGSVGRTLLWNLISHPFGGTVFPINPKRASVLGIKAYPNLAAIPEPVDLVVIAIPSLAVPQVIDECVAAGVKAAIIISAGFKEIGAEGVELERQILAKARAGNLRIVGPNCLGVMCPVSGLNATFASAIARPGNVGFISQSGALCTSILDWSFRENVGFSAFISIGSMLDVDWGDLIDYLGDDPDTHSIVIYMESIGNARSFLSAAREVARTKPIIVIKAGRTEAAAAAAASHTGALAGSDEVLNAAFRRCGVLRVDTIDDLFNMAEVLAKQPRPKGNRLTILTNAGGPGVLTTDALISEGGKLAKLSPETTAKLNELLPPHWSHGNPVDILGDADPHRYAEAIRITLDDPNSDGLLAILTPQAMTDPTQTAKQFVEILQDPSRPAKPILASWMGGDGITPGEQLLNHARIFTLPFPDTAAHVFNYMWRYSYNLQGLYETPMITTDEEQAPGRDRVTAMIAAVRAEGRNLLTEYESKQLLDAYGIPTVATAIATSADAAVAQAEAIGYPVVLKLNSTTITHKTDVGGVRLLLQDADTVRGAYNGIQDSVTEKVGAEHFQGVTVQPMLQMTQGDYELIIGSSLDAQFGPVLLFGTGGSLVEVFKDRALGLPPLNTTLARRMIEQTKIYTALKGVRGQAAVDLDMLEQLLVRFSQLVVEQAWIKELDINPLLVGSDRLVALDARVVLHDPETPEADLPKPAICPYPLHYVAPWTLKDGTNVVIRPIRPEDEPLVVKFHEPLSEESVYLRYFHLMSLKSRVAHDRLSRICFIDYDREIALVADYKDPETGEHQFLGVARISQLHGVNEAEFAMIISDRCQNQGLGTELLQRLVAIGRDRNFTQLVANILPENTGMQRVCQKVGFRLQHLSPDTVLAVLTL